MTERALAFFFTSHTRDKHPLLLSNKSFSDLQIKEKLMEHGLAENTTVMWRKQLDGEVFYKEKNTTVDRNTRDTGEL